jgi:hypothetical protein
VTATTLAEVVADVRAGRIVRPGYINGEFAEWADDLLRACMRFAPQAPLVDATMIFDTYHHREAIRLYEDHEYCRPPWDVCWVGHRNSFGNLVVTLGQQQPTAPAQRAPRCGICHAEAHPGGAADCPQLNLGPGLLEVSP